MLRNRPVLSRVRAARRSKQVGLPPGQNVPDRVWRKKEREKPEPLRSGERVQEINTSTYQGPDRRYQDQRRRFRKDRREPDPAVPT